MTTVTGQSTNVQTYDKSTDVAPKTKAQPQEKPENAPSLSSNDKLQTYTVKKGDTLWGISKDKLGNAQKWPNIFEANKDQIKNPNRIYPNQVLNLPIAVPHEPPATPEKPVEDPKPVQVDPKPVDVKPTPAPDKPVTPPAVVTPPQPNVPIATKKNHLVLNSAGVGAAVGVAATTGLLVGMTAALARPLSNLGGYATAQIVSRNLGKIGLSLGSAPQVASLVKSVGGPKVAGAIAVVGVGVAVAGLAAGGAYMYNKMNNK